MIRPRPTTCLSPTTTWSSRTTGTGQRWPRSLLLPCTPSPLSRRASRGMTLLPVWPRGRWSSMMSCATSPRQSAATVITPPTRPDRGSRSYGRGSRLGRSASLPPTRSTMTILHRQHPLPATEGKKERGEQEGQEEREEQVEREE